MTLYHTLNKDYTAYSIEFVVQFEIGPIFDTVHSTLFDNAVYSIILSSSRMCSTVPTEGNQRNSKSWLPGNGVDNKRKKTN